MQAGVQAEIWYLYHSGFAVKTDSHFLLFDYYSDTPDGLERRLDTGVINPDEVNGEDVVVFASHRHPDHFNPVILGWPEKIPSIRYVLSYDIRAVKKAENVLTVRPGQQYDFGGVHIEVLASTDVGVAFLLETDGLCIYHAGDLNWWHWEGEPADENQSMARAYQKQIGLLRGRKIDLAFVPLDPRLGVQASFGLDYFMKTVGAQMVFPMHFGSGYEVIQRLGESGCPYFDRVAQITRRGQQFHYAQGKQA